jgi:hypothetical protein
MTYNPSDYDSKLAEKAQTEYVKKNNFPDFAPPFGRCWSCKKNIYEPVAWTWNDYWEEVPLDSPEATRITGITVKEAGERLITGCPHCHRSYCD